MIDLNQFLFIGHVDELLRPFADRVFEIGYFLFERLLLVDQIDQILLVFLSRDEDDDSSASEESMYLILVR